VQTTPVSTAISNLAVDTTKHSIEIETTPTIQPTTIGAASATLADRLVAEIAANGGEIKTTQRGLARLMGVDAGNLNRAVHGLVAAGVVAASIGRHGTSLSLAS
jgi:predicted transcriptional regulator